jgi:hypothetical protein
MFNKLSISQNRVRSTRENYVRLFLPPSPPPFSSFPLVNRVKSPVGAILTDNWFRERERVALYANCAIAENHTCTGRATFTNCTLTFLLHCLLSLLLTVSLYHPFIIYSNICCGALYYRKCNIARTKMFIYVVLFVF